MNQAPDLLADRVSQWAAQIHGAGAEGELSLRGWALLGELKRRGPSAGHLIETVESRLGKLPYGMVAGQIERATSEWRQLLADLDREEENLEHVRRASRDVFFLVLEALIVAEESGEATEAAQGLFNAVANELYVFEPMANVAAELERWGTGETQLSDLLCTGVARMFDGQVQSHPAAQPATVEEFVSMGTMLKEAGRALTPAELARRISKVEWWFVKWATSRVQVAVMAKKRLLCLYVWQGAEAGLAMSGEMDGWEVRVGNGRETTSAAIASGSVVLTLPKQIDPGTFGIQIRSAGAGEWNDLFARVGA